MCRVTKTVELYDLAERVSIETSSALNPTLFLVT